MKYLILITILILFSGCGLKSLTVHDYCMKELEHYKDYEECYKATEQNHKNDSFMKGLTQALGSGMQDVGNGVSGAASQPRPQQNCTFYKDADPAAIHGVCQ